MILYRLATKENTYQSFVLNENDSSSPLIGLRFEKQNIKDTWQIMKVVWGSRSKRIKMGNIFSIFFGGSLPVFDNKTIETLNDLLEPSGEFLPIICTNNNETYFIFHCTVFKNLNDVLKNNIPSVFRLTEAPFCNSIIVNQEFVSRVTDNKLKGFKFDVFDTSNIKKFQLALSRTIR